MKTVNICIFGDSIAYGGWDNHGGWVDRLRSFLHAGTLASHFQSYHFVYHLGIPGDKTHDLLTRLPNEARVREPQVIILAIGINDARWCDCKRTPFVEEQAFRENAVKLIAEARRFTPTIIFLGLTPVDETKTMPYEPGIYFENERIRRYDAIMRELAAAASVLYLPAYDILSPPEDLEDGLHPNARGHEKLFILVRDFLSSSDII